MELHNSNYYEFWNSINETDLWSSKNDLRQFQLHKWITELHNSCIIMENHKWIMELQNSFMELHNSIYGVP